MNLTDEAPCAPLSVRPCEPLASASGSDRTVHPLSDEDHRHEQQTTSPFAGTHFPSDGANAIVCPEGHVGDRSPKSKERDQKQKNAAKAESAAQARSKQDGQSQAPQIPGKPKK